MLREALMIVSTVHAWYINYINHKNSILIQNNTLLVR